MMRELRAAAVVFVGLSLLVCGLYPLAVTGIGQSLFPFQANGSILERDGTKIGSALIGQSTNDPSLFWGRPSASEPDQAAGRPSGGSNLAATNPELVRQIEDRIAVLLSADPEETRPIPTELVTASASGLDPHLGLAATEWQIPRVSRATGIPEEALREAIRKSTEDSLLDSTEPVVNILKLNDALKDLQ